MSSSSSYHHSRASGGGGSNSNNGFSTPTRPEKRRTFAFLTVGKSSPSTTTTTQQQQQQQQRGGSSTTKKKSSAYLRRTREHARQIAMSIATPDNNNNNSSSSRALNIPGGGFIASPTTTTTTTTTPMTPSSYLPPKPTQHYRQSQQQQQQVEYVMTSTTPTTSSRTGTNHHPPPSPRRQRMDSWGGGGDAGSVGNISMSDASSFSNASSVYDMEFLLSPEGGEGEDVATTTPRRRRPKSRNTTISSSGGGGGRKSSSHKGNQRMDSETGKNNNNNKSMTLDLFVEQQQQQQGTRNNHSKQTTARSEVSVPHSVTSASSIISQHSSSGGGGMSSSVHPPPRTSRRRRRPPEIPPPPSSEQQQQQQLPVVVPRMSTFPSNSIVNAKNLSNSSSSSSGGGGGVAAGRRKARHQPPSPQQQQQQHPFRSLSVDDGVQQQQRLEPEGIVPTSPYPTSSAGGSSSPDLFGHHHQQHQQSQLSSPFVRQNSFGSYNSGSQKDRLAAYQTRNASSAVIVVQESPPSPTHSSIRTEEEGDMDVDFDDDHDDAFRGGHTAAGGGFTFDAFGLDANQVDMEVTAAIQAMERTATPAAATTTTTGNDSIADGSSSSEIMTDFGFFSSSNNNNNMMMMMMDRQSATATPTSHMTDEFPDVSFDSPTPYNNNNNNSGGGGGGRTQTPTLGDDHDDDDEGFEDGFRITGGSATTLLWRTKKGGGIISSTSSPPSSSQSSLTESTDPKTEGRRNMFKEQAGFATSSKNNNSSRGRGRTTTTTTTTTGGASSLLSQQPPISTTSRGGGGGGGATTTNTTEDQPTLHGGSVAGSSSSVSPLRNIPPDQIPPQWADFGSYNSDRAVGSRSSAQTSVMIATTPNKKKEHHHHHPAMMTTTSTTTRSRTTTTTTGGGATNTNTGETFSTATTEETTKGSLSAPQQYQQQQQQQQHFRSFDTRSPPSSLARQGEWGRSISPRYNHDGSDTGVGGGGGGGNTTPFGYKSDAGVSSAAASDIPSDVGVNSDVMVDYAKEPTSTTITHDGDGGHALNTSISSIQQPPDRSSTMMSMEDVPMEIAGKTKKKKKSSRRGGNKKGDALPTTTNATVVADEPELEGIAQQLSHAGVKSSVSSLKNKWEQQAHQQQQSSSSLSSPSRQQQQQQQQQKQSPISRPRTPLGSDLVQSVSNQLGEGMMLTPEQLSRQIYGNDRMVMTNASDLPLTMENLRRVQNQQQQQRRVNVKYSRDAAVEDDRAQQRAMEGADQRGGEGGGSFTSNKSRLKSSNLHHATQNHHQQQQQYDAVGSSSKSDFTAGQSSGTYNWRSHLKGTTSGDYRRSPAVESKSDSGGCQQHASSKPAWAAVKLRSTGGAAPTNVGQGGAVSPFQSDQYGEEEYEDWEPEYHHDSHQQYESSPPQVNMTYRERQEELNRRKEQEEIRAAMHSPDTTLTPARRKPTYRERRERELREEAERKAAEEAASRKYEEPKLDVAATIKKRIAANKAKAYAAGARESSAISTVSSGVSGGEDITNMRNRLKKVSMESKISQLKTTSPRNQPSLNHTSSYDARDQSYQPSPSNHGYTVSLSPTTPAPAAAAPATERYEYVSPKRTSTPQPALHSNSAPPVEQRQQQQDCLVQNETSSPQIASPLKETAPEHTKGPVASSALQNLFAQRAKDMQPQPAETETESIAATTNDTKKSLNAFFANRNSSGPNLNPTGGGNADDDTSALKRQKDQKVSGSQKAPAAALPVANIAAAAAAAAAAVAGRSAPSSAPKSAPSDSRPALKDDPKYDRYFRMLKVGMPLDVVKHAMTRDGYDPSVMDGDHNLPAHGAGVPLKDDPKYSKYFKMLKIGLPMGAVKNALERDGLDPSIMDCDHNLPAPKSGSNANAAKNVPKDTHRRTRLHWDILRQVRKNSLWAKIDSDNELKDIHIDEEEFNQLFQAELTPAEVKTTSTVVKRGVAVRVIDSKRANNGGIILARLKMTHDEMADAVDRIDESSMTAEQMQNIIEFLPTTEERSALENYMLSGGTDAAEKFDGLCECEKFMVAMMTVKHAKRKVRALLFKLQFLGCLESLENDAALVETSCDELSNSIRLRKLLGIVLNIGNRLNTAGVSGKRKAGAFRLESLLKLSHAKAFDRKTTFLHYIVLILQRNNELLLRFMDDLPTVMKSDRVYWDQVVNDLEEVENQLENVRRIALHQARRTRRYRKKTTKPADDGDDSMSDCSMSLEEEVASLRATEIGMFTLNAIKKVSALRDKVERTKVKFGRLLEYFGEDNQEMQPHELFNIMVTFCRDFEKAKEVVYSGMKKKMREDRKRNMAANGKKSGKGEAQQQHDSKQKQQQSKKMLRASSHQPNMSTILNHESATSDPNSSSTPVARNGDGGRSSKPAEEFYPSQRKEGYVYGSNKPAAPTVVRSDPTTTKVQSSYGYETKAEPQLRYYQSGNELPEDEFSTGTAPSRSQNQQHPSPQQEATMYHADMAANHVRQKAEMRRRRAQQASRSGQSVSTGTTSATTQTTGTTNNSTQIMSSGSRHPSSQQVRQRESSHDASSSKQSVSQASDPSGHQHQPAMSPRSSIRRRRRMERRQRAVTSSQRVQEEMKMDI